MIIDRPHPTVITSKQHYEMLRIAKRRLVEKERLAKLDQAKTIADEYEFDTFELMMINT